MVVRLHRGDGLGSRFDPLTVTRFLFGAGEAGCFPEHHQNLFPWLPAKEKVRAQGIVWMAARWGGAFTPPLVSLVILQVGWRHAFELFGLIGPVWALCSSSGSATIPWTTRD